MHEKKTLSFYDTYSEVKESLCFQDSEEIFSLDEKKVHQLLTDQPISYSKSFLPYFSCVFIIDKDSTIPLFFCKTVNLLINNKKYIRSKEDSLLVNPLAIETLSSLQVDLSFIKMTDDKSEIVFKIISSLKVMDLEKRINVKFGLKFFKDNIEYSCANYFFLKTIIDNKITDKKMLSFIKNTSPLSFEGKNQKEIFSLYKETLKELNKTSAMVVKAGDKYILKDYFLFYIDYCLSERKNMVIITKNEKDYNFLLDILKKKYLSQIVNSYESIKKKEILAKIDAKLKTHFKNEHRREMRKYFIIKNKIMTLINENISGFTIPLNSDDILYLIKVISKGDINATSDMDLQGYSFSLLNADINFFKEINKLDKLNFRNVKENVFYGLSCSSSRKNYDLLIITMIQIVDTLDFFVSVLKQNNIKDFSSREITSFYQFEQYGKYIDFLYSYNGIPLEFFLDTISEDEESSILFLKNKYQKFSSCKLLVSSLFKKSIFSADIKKLLQNYDLTRRRSSAINEIDKHLKNKQKDYQTIFELLRTYLKTKKEIEDILPEYEKKYGKAIRNVNGIVDILANIKYISGFTYLHKKDKDFSLDNPLVKRCLLDRSYMISIHNIYNNLNTIYQKLKKNINLCIGYFLDDDFMYLKEDFTSLKDHFLKRIKGKYDEFYQYSSFVKLISKSSSLLQKEIDKRIKEKRSLDGFSYYYLTSIMKSYQQRRHKMYSNQLKAFSSSKGELLFSIMKSINSFDRLRSDKYFKIVEENVNSKQFKSLKEKINTDTDKCTIEESKVLKKLNSMRFPITILKSDSLYRVDDYQFDEALIFNSHLLSDKQLCQTLRVSNKALFLSKISDNDERIFPLHEFALTNEFLYLNSFSVKSVPKEAIAPAEREVKKRNHTLDLNNRIFPIILKNIDKPLKRIAIMPDIFINSDKIKDIYFSLPKNMMSIYNLPVLCVDTIDYLLSPLKESFILKDIIDEINYKYKDYLNEKQEKKNIKKDDPYQKELKRIISSFPVYKSYEDNMILYKNNDFSSLFYSLQPFNKSTLKRYGEEFTNYVDYMIKNSGVVIFSGGFYMDISKEKIHFRKSKRENREASEISIIELQQGIKQFFSSFSSFDIDDLKSIFASLVDYDKEDADFSLRFDEAIAMLVNENIIRIQDREASLFFSLDSIEQ